MTGSAEPHLTPVAASARLDRLPTLTRAHRIWVVLLCAAFLFELADLNTFAYVAPALQKHWGISVSSVGTVTSAGFLGMFIGALIGGRMADLLGRRWALIGATAFYSLFSLISAASPNIVVLGVFRVLTGVGLEAMTVIGLLFIAEMFPARQRGRYQSLVLGIGLIGIPVMSWFARGVVPLGGNTWRWVFVLGAVGLIAAIAMFRWLPESVRWLEAHHRIEQANALVTPLEAEVRDRTGAALPTVTIQTSSEYPGRIRELFTGRYRNRTLILSLAWIFGILGFYGFNSWVPTLLVQNGYPIVESLTYTAILSIGAVPGALLAWPMIDRWERKHTIIVIELITAAFVLVYGFVANVPVILVAGFCTTMLLQTQTAFLYTYTPEVFPTRLRGAGTGFTNGLGRLAGVAGGVLVAAVFAAWGYTSVFIYVAAAMTLAGLVIVLFGPHTSQRSLETITETSTPTGPGQPAPGPQPDPAGEAASETS